MQRAMLRGRAWLSQRDRLREVSFFRGKVVNGSPVKGDCKRGAKDVAHLEEHLPSVQPGLGSIPSTS